MTQAIYFDMDGTVANLYAVEQWEPKLRASDPSPYREAVPVVDMTVLANLCHQLMQAGITIGVISWLAMDSTKEYDCQVREAKRAWLKQWMPYVQEVHLIKYGRTKKSAARIKDAILVDDNAKVRAGWSGVTIDATQDILKELKKVLDKVTQS